MTNAVEAARAELLLLKIEQNEDLVQQWAASPAGMMREMYAEMYRTIVGVDPEDRNTLREGLEAIRDTRTMGEVTVESVTRRVRSGLDGPIN